MLSRARFGDNTRFAHAFCQEPLSERVIDFVRPCVRQVFAFQINSRAAAQFGQPFCKIQRRRASDKFYESGSRPAGTQRGSGGRGTRGVQQAADIHWLRPEEAPAWEVRIQPALLGQLLDNLLDNACKYSEPGTPITIRVERAWRLHDLPPLAPVTGDQSF